MKENLQRSQQSISRGKGVRHKVIAFFMLLILCAIWLFPFIYVFGMSFRTVNDMALYPTSVFPHSDGWTLENYAVFFKVTNGKLDVLLNAMINSIATTTVNVVINLIITVLAAYSYVFMRYKGRVLIYTLIISVMAVPSVIGFAPLFSMYVSIGKQFDILNTLSYFYVWIIFPGIAGAFNLMIMVNCFKNMPKDIVESARSDGASEFSIFRRVVLPLARSSMLVCALFAFNASWNNFMFPQLVVATQSDPQLHSTVTVSLMGWIQNTDISFRGTAMATCVVSLIPLAVMYVLTQNKMIDGLASTGIKG